MMEDEGCNKKMEVKLLVFQRTTLDYSTHCLVWMSVMIQEWNNSWIANTVILYFPNQISKEPIRIQLFKKVFYVKSRQNLEFVFQVLIFFFKVWNELKLEDFEKGELQSKVKSSLTTRPSTKLGFSSKISISLAL